jgi:hypothetical protein
VPTNSTDPTSPAVPEGIVDSDVRAYNTAAVEVATSLGASVLDLHAVVTSACGGVGYTSCPQYQEPNNPHFIDAGWSLLATAVAKAVQATPASCN